MLSSLTYSPYLWVHPNRSYASVILEHVQLPSTPDNTLHKEKTCVSDLHHQLFNLAAHLKPLIQQKMTLYNLSSSQFLFQLFLQKHGHCGFLIILAPELSISQREILPLPCAQHLAQSLPRIISNTEN